MHGFSTHESTGQVQGRLVNLFAPVPGTIGICVLSTDVWHSGVHAGWLTHDCQRL